VKIAASTLLLSSQHAAVTRREQSETLRAWTGPQRPDFENSPAAVLRVSDAARALAAASPPPPPPPPATASAEAEAIAASQDAVDNDPFLQLVKSMVEMLTGRAVWVFSAAEFSREAEVHAADTAEATAVANPGRRAGFGVEYDFHSIHEESEVTTVSASGTIRTADGAEISFRLDLAMSRSFREETHVSLRAGDAVRKDPLVVNFGGTAAQLSDRTFRFDLDADGRAEELPLFASGSGYLALDLDGNGKIDSGAELFGPTTNSGYAELARHDEDGNGWIDENDRAFDRLQVWTPAADGPGRLVSLRDAGVGALALAHAASPFELRGTGNSDLGGVRASGVWLSESGQAGSLQEIDLTV
jgi:hypothetical protein